MTPADRDQAPNAAPVVRTGRILSAAESREWQKLRELADPSQSVERANMHAKWLFGGTTTVALLAAGLSAGGVGHLRGGAHVAFAVAEVLLAGAMASAAFCLAPHWAEYNPASRDSVEAALAASVKKQRRWLTAGSVLFALSLIAAGSVPLAQRGDPTAYQFAFSLSDAGRLEIKSSAKHLPDGAILETYVTGLGGRPTKQPGLGNRGAGGGGASPAPSSSGDSAAAPGTPGAGTRDSVAIAPYVRVVADSAGTADIFISVPATRWGVDSLRIVTSAHVPGGKTIHSETVSLVLQDLRKKTP